MANTVRIKRRTSGNAGAPTSLENAELAFNEVDDILYYGKGTGGAGGTATTVEAIGGKGAMVTLSGDQTINGNKTFSNSPILPTPTTGDNSTKGATTAFVKAQNYLTANQSITVSGDASGSGTTAISLTLASVGISGTYTKVTTDAKGRVTSGTTLSATDIPTLTAAKISDFDTQVRTSTLNQMAAPTSALSVNSQKITNLATPTADTDAATKGYVDSAIQGLDPKGSVKAATTANIASLSGTMTIDGVSLVAGDRVLVKDQTTTSANGIYVVAAGAWSRASDMDTWGEVPAAYVFVEQGTTYADVGFICTAEQGGTLGTTPITWQTFTGASQVIAGAGLTKTGNQLDIGAGTGITVNADDVALAGQALALHNLSTNGIFVRTGAGTVSARTITASGSGLTITNGDGVSANPTVSLSTALSTIGSLTPATDSLPYYTSGSVAALTTLTGFARGLLDDADAATARTTLGLDSMAVQASSNVTITGGTINGITIDGGTF